jgi:hypothetical protein
MEDLIFPLIIIILILVTILLEKQAIYYLLQEYGATKIQIRYRGFSFERNPDLY